MLMTSPGVSFAIKGQGLLNYFYVTPGLEIKYPKKTNIKAGILSLPPPSPQSVY